MNFRVGQKVVCVDDGGIDRQFYRASDGTPFKSKTPTKDGVYTVRACPSATGILLEEIRNEIAATILETAEPRWKAVRFRPLVAAKTDISIFTKMLTDTREPVGTR